jgi:predicted RNase H-like HicB family nuclease
LLCHRITLSALASTFGGIVKPICFAVFRLITISNFVGCSVRTAGCPVDFIDISPQLVITGEAVIESKAGGIMMRYSVLLEPINEPEFQGYYYAHIPTLDLTTQGMGIEGALGAAQELVEVWVQEKRSHGESVPVETKSLIAQVEIPDAVLGP